MKKAVFLFVFLSLFVISFVPSAAFAAEAVADYGKVMRSITGYNEAQKRYNEIVAQAKSTLELQIKMSKSDVEKQKIINQYGQFCAQQKREIFDPLIGKMKYVLQQIAKEKGYTKVSAKGAGTDGVDITQEAIDRLNGVSVRVTAQDEGKDSLTAPVNGQQAAAAVSKESMPRQAERQQPEEDKKAAAVTEVQFGAGYDKDAIYSVVARAAKNGIDSAYVAEAQDKRGRTLWRARATVASDKEARDICAKLSRMGLKNFVVR